ncbi:hypothetical protein [Piscirickettsia salmonis]|nr:hypothetical protein [Piscirickettsia salmonis]ALT18973.1 hypothetical protein PSLF89_09065 [Piscirickettsia salmonis LF-89 = ATCC VR-1361]
MKAINQAWNVLSEIGDINASDYFSDNDNTDFYSDDTIINQLKKAIEALNNLVNPDLELCGVWLYLHSDLRGENYKKTRELMKVAGWRWSTKKSVWYYNPEPQKVKRTKHRRGWELDKIRGTYGSNKYHDQAKKSRYINPL